MEQKTTTKRSDKELLELGKKLQGFYDAGYVNRKQALLFSFLKGLVTGFGAFLGGTVLIGVVLAIISLFKDLPLWS